jgi:hypothetical protein
VDEDERQDLNDLESVVQRTTDHESSTLYCTYPVRTFLSMSVHHNNKQHNCGLQLFCLKRHYVSLLRLRLPKSNGSKGEKILCCEPHSSMGEAAAEIYTR